LARALGAASLRRRARRFAGTRLGTGPGRRRRPAVASRLTFAPRAGAIPGFATLGRPARGPVVARGGLALADHQHVAGGDAIPDRHLDLDDRARRRRRHVDRRLLGLEADERVFRRHAVADLDEDIGDLDVGDVTEIGYGDFHERLRLS